VININDGKNVKNVQDKWWKGKEPPHVPCKYLKRAPAQNTKAGK
jgi:hypothetical protein